MPELSGSTPARRGQHRSVALAELAAKQGGVVSRDQLVRVGVSDSAISRWVRLGRLHRIHPRVYAVGHSLLGIRGRLVAALLYAGPGSALSHTAAGWAWCLLTAEPGVVHISAPGDRRTVRGVRMHHPRQLEIVRHNGLPVTTVPRTLLDLAATLSFADLRRALAQADYRRLLDPAAVAAALCNGRPGSAALRAAVSSHMPELAHTLSALEERFIALCESAGLPRPEVNATVEGLMVDALFRRQRVVVELDGAAAHATQARMEQDRSRDLTLRASGYTVLRYTWRQVTRDPAAVVADVRGALWAPASS